MESLASSATMDGLKRAESHVQQQTPRILLVEDAEDLVAIWRALFRATGWDARFATTAKMALTQIADGFMPDVLVSDYYLPDMTGIDLITKLRSLYPNLTFLMVSGNRDQQFCDEVAACGDVRLMFKPIKFPDLKRALQDMLAPAAV